MCYKCGAALRCGNPCCRSKSNGPYWHGFQNGDEHYEVCEVCGFCLDANVSMDLNYDECVINGSWFRCMDEDDPRRACQADWTVSSKANYEKLMDRYVRNVDTRIPGSEIIPLA